MGRTGGKVRTAVHFLVIMTLRPKKKEFLSNQDSKHMFTAMLFRSLEQSGCEVHQAKADADLLIIQTTAASVANPKETDLLVVLVYHAKSVHVHKSERCWYIPFL